MTDAYTPSTGEVRRRYAFARSANAPGKNQSAVAEFDRFIAALRAEWEAEQGEPRKVYVVAVDYPWEGYGPPEMAFASRNAAEAYVAENSQSTYAYPEIFELDVE